MRLALVLLALTAMHVQASSEAALDSIAPGLSMMVHEEPASKSLVAEFETFLAVVESPGDAANAHALIEACAETFPDKPIRFLFHTHHHGHSIGSIDPWLVRGVTVVTGRDNLGRIRGKSADPERFDRLALVVDDGFRLADGTNEIVVHALREDDYKVPTSEYLVFEFPGKDLLISGCLYNKPLTYHEVINQRKPALRSALADRMPDVQTLVPTNTTAASGFEMICSVDMLDATLEEGMDPWAENARLRDMSIEEIEASLDDLAAELAERTPRSFDLLVTGNTMRSLGEEPHRAALFLEAAARAFPEDARVRYYQGVAYWEAGLPIDAEVVWGQALELASDDEDRARLEGRMEEVRAESPDPGR